MTLDSKLFQTYTDMMQSMSRSTRNPDAAELLFWYLTYGVIAQSKVVAKSDLLGIVMKQFTGDSSGCVEIVWATTEQTENYLQFHQKYGLSDKLSELGDHWKEIFWKGRFGQVLILRGWLKMFIGDCLPAINDTLTEYEHKWQEHDGITEKDLKSRQRMFAAYKRKLNTLLTKLETAKEFYDLRRTDPNYYQNED